MARHMASARAATFTTIVCLSITSLAAQTVIKHRRIDPSHGSAL